MKNFFKKTIFLFSIVLLSSFSNAKNVTVVNAEQSGYDTEQTIQNSVVYEQKIVTTTIKLTAKSRSLITVTGPAITYESNNSVDNQVETKESLNKIDANEEKNDDNPSQESVIPSQTEN